MTFGRNRGVLSCIAAVAACPMHTLTDSPPRPSFESLLQLVHLMRAKAEVTQCAS